MQLFDRNDVFKDWNTLKQEHNLLNILYFQRMQLISSIPSGKILKQNNDIYTVTTIQHRFIQNSRVLTVQNITSLMLYWILIATTEHKATSKKKLKKMKTWKKIHWSVSRLERNLHDTSPFFQQYLCEMFWTEKLVLLVYR